MTMYNIGLPSLDEILSLLYGNKKNIVLMWPCLLSGRENILTIVSQMKTI
jgi:hypothetical protein